MGFLFPKTVERCINCRFKKIGKVYAKDLETKAEWAFLLLYMAPLLLIVGLPVD